jgi:cytochrome c556
MKLRTVWSSSALVLGATLALGAAAQNAPGGGGPPSPAKRAIEIRQSLFTLIGANWNPVGGNNGVVAGKMEYNAADVTKRVDRVAFLATMASEVFPEVSKDGETKAKPEIWTDKAGFAKAVKDLEDSTSALATLVKTDKTNSAAFKAAAGKVADSCKGCHDNYRAK